MSFALSLSGLDGAAKAIDVIGNNIANSQTIGFKSSKARFADLFAASVVGASDNGLGTGVSTAIIEQEFTQGTLIQSDRPLDMAITGAGFFRLNNGGAISYSRDGQFQLSYDAKTPNTRVLVNSTGLNVTGYPVDYTADPKGVIVTTAAPQNISISQTMPALATGKVAIGVTLDARVPVPSVVPFDAVNPLTYSSTTALAVFDSTGASHNLEMYFARSAPGNLWDVYTTLDGGAPSGPLSLAFDSNGLMTTTMPLAAQTYPLSAGGSLPVVIDFTGTVQYGTTFSVGSKTQDGYANGTIDSSSAFSVGSDGIISAMYSNGQARKIAQIALANFVNPNALISQGDNQWTANADPVRGSGQEILDTPGRTTGKTPMGLGTIQGSAKEQSNVDLSTELVALIEQQRNYQASAQTLKILDQVLQNLATARA